MIVSVPGWKQRINDGYGFHNQGCRTGGSQRGDGVKSLKIRPFELFRETDNGYLIETSERETRNLNGNSGVPA